MQPRVAIILLNWNGIDDTLECIASLERLDFPSYRIIVVDNASRVDPSDQLADRTNVIVVRNNANLGFAMGNNVGIRRAAKLGAQYCWILNNDTEVEPDSLRKLVDRLDADQTFGAVTNLILYSADRSLVWFAGGIFDRHIPAHRGFFTQRESIPVGTDTEYLSGCSFLAHTDILTRIGGFDERYFCYVEDIDISMRMLHAGMRIGYVPDAVVYHKVSRSTGTGAYSPAKLYYKHRNMLYFYGKFHHPSEARRRWWLMSLRLAASLVLKHHKPAAAWHLLHGLTDATRGRMGYCSRF